MKDFKDLGFEEIDQPKFDDLGFESEAEPKYSKAETALLHGTKGITAGFGEELGAKALAAPMTAYQWLAQHMLGTPEQVNKQLTEQGFKLPAEDQPKTLMDVAQQLPIAPGFYEGTPEYRQLRDTSRQAAEESAKEHPVLAPVAQVGGALGSIIIPGMAAANATKLPLAAGTMALKAGLPQVAARTAAAGTNIAAQGAMGGAYGAAQGLGESQAELQNPENMQVGQALQDVKESGKTGAMFGAAIPGAGAALKPAAEGIKKVGTGLYNTMPDVVKKILDTGIATAKGKSPFGSVKKSAADIGETGIELGQKLKQFDDLSTKQITSILSPKQTFDFNNELNQYKKLISDSLRSGTKAAKEDLLNATENINQINPNMNLQQFMDFEKDLSTLIPSASDNAKAVLSGLRRNIREDLLKKIKEAYPEKPEISQQFAELFRQRSVMHDALDGLPRNFSGVTTRDADVLDKFRAKTEGLSGYGAKEKSIEFTGAETSEGKKILGVADKLKEIIPEAKPILNKLGEQQRLLALKEFGQSADFLTGTIKHGARYGSAAIGGIAGIPLAAGRGLNRLMNMGEKIITNKAMQLEMAGDKTGANFLRNFASADVNKKKALLFTASQNPDLRKSLDFGSELSELEE